VTIGLSMARNQEVLPPLGDVYDAKLARAVSLGYSGDLVDAAGKRYANYSMKARKNRIDNFLGAQTKGTSRVSFQEAIGASSRPTPQPRQLRPSQVVVSPSSRPLKPETVLRFPAGSAMASIDADGFRQTITFQHSSLFASLRDLVLLHPQLPVHRLIIQVAVLGAGRDASFHKGNIGRFTLLNRVPPLVSGFRMVNTVDIVSSINGYLELDHTVPNFYTADFLSENSASCVTLRDLLSFSVAFELNSSKVYTALTVGSGPAGAPTATELAAHKAAWLASNEYLWYSFYIVTEGIPPVTIPDISSSCNSMCVKCTGPC